MTPKEFSDQCREAMRGSTTVGPNMLFCEQGPVCAVGHWMRRHTSLRSMTEVESAGEDEVARVLEASSGGVSYAAIMNFADGFDSGVRGHDTMARGQHREWWRAGYELGLAECHEHRKRAHE